MDLAVATEETGGTQCRGMWPRSMP
jgi:hypothetical protein